MSSQKASPSGGVKGMAKAHAVEILNLPDEPKDGYHGLPDSPATWKLQNSGFFDDCGYCDGRHPNCPDYQCEHDYLCECGSAERRCDVKIWKLSPIANEVIEWLDEPNTLPCGHQGLRNLRDGGFTCQKETCDEEYPKAVAKQVIR